MQGYLFERRAFSISGRRLALKRVNPKPRIYRVSAAGFLYVASLASVRAPTEADA
jgi:hypothetical protein